VCGNYVIRLGWGGCPAGSPPRVRELHLFCGPVRGPVGITPACAGITGEDRPDKALDGDHPRVCGNYNSSPSPGSNSWGSPPRVRELL